jgi:selenophosphate synthase
VPKEEIMKQKPDRVLIFCLAGFVALQFLVALRDITGFGALGHEMNVVGAAISLFCAFGGIFFLIRYIRNG